MVLTLSKTVTPGHVLAYQPLLLRYQNPLPPLTPTTKPVKPTYQTPYQTLPNPLYQTPIDPVKSLSAPYQIPITQPAISPISLISPLNPLSAHLAFKAYGEGTLRVMGFGVW